MKWNALSPITLLFPLLFAVGCAHLGQPDPANPHTVITAKTFGRIERLEAPSLDELGEALLRFNRPEETEEWLKRHAQPLQYA